jgi:hypothetical protein
MQQKDNTNFRLGNVLIAIISFPAFLVEEFQSKDTAKQLILANRL